MGFGVCYMVLPNLLLGLLGALELEVELLLALDWNAANTSQRSNGRSEGTGEHRRAMDDLREGRNAYRAGCAHRTYWEGGKDA